MIEISKLPDDHLAGIEVVLSDIDDTISTEGKLTPLAYEALWSLRDHGVKVVLVTGRPAGWCDHIARFWPVDAIVGENGGFYFIHNGEKLIKHYLYSQEERKGFQEKLEALRTRILKEVPGCALASDQPYREYDLAVDFCEDVPPLKQKDVLRIQQIFHEAGAHAKISSIHVNGWYGDFDKLTTSLKCVKECFNIEGRSQNRAMAYCGDSPNDEPMFAFFELSFGMANVIPFLNLMTHKPAYVTDLPCGAGFEQVVKKVLKARTSGEY